MPPSRICIDCGTRYKGTGNRCNLHSRTREPRPGRYPYKERQRMTAVKEQWIKANGYLCPGYKREGHEAPDLTVDHITPISQGGTGGPLRVLCRACNSRRGAGTAATL